MTTGIPTTPKRFKNWLAKQKDLPAGLRILGQRYVLCLSMIALNRNNPDALKMAKRTNADDMKKFMDAYAKWNATK